MRFASICFVSFCLDLAKRLSFLPGGGGVSAQDPQWSQCRESQGEPVMRFFQWDQKPSNKETIFNWIMWLMDLAFGF